MLRRQFDCQTELEKVVLGQGPAELEAQFPFLSVFTKVHTKRDGLKT